MHIHSKRVHTCLLRSRGPECALVALLGLTGACDPGVKVDGTVYDSDGGPLSGATVELRCPPNHRITIGGPVLTTDAGTFLLTDAVGCAAPDCTVSVRAPTGEQVEYPVGGNCRRRYWNCGKSCNEIHVDGRF
jgi:hypothetical protein